MHILEIMRVKDFERAVNKIARRVCEARETYRTGLKRKLEDKNSSGRYYIMDVIANIHYRLEGEPTGMRLEEEEIIRIAEGIIEAQYVSAVAETVWDWFGVKYVVEDLPTVNVLVSDAINLGAGFIPDKGMVRKRIRGQLKKSQYVWVTGTSVDNHYYLPPSDKNNMIFTSIRTDPSILGFSERLDLCFTRFRDYIFDELGEGCHHLYEGRQIDKMRSHSSAIVRDGYEELHRRGFELITPEFRGQVQSMLVNGI